MIGDSTLAHLFSAYNAKQLDPEEVASTFVPSKKFWTLLEPNNSLLIGPRGSGKTTLLKMLQPLALLNWKHERASEARRSANFHGVFIPTDLNWKEEITVAVEALKTDEKQTLTEALFVANIQLAFVTTLMQLSTDSLQGEDCFLPIELRHEAEIVSALEKSWNFESDEIPTSSFRSLRRGFRGRIRRLSSYRPNMPNREEAIEAIQKTLNVSQFGFETTILEVVGLVEDVTNIKRKWALCFDEVELAPEFIQVSLFRRLRSPSASIFYKLAVAPYVPAAHLLNRTEMPGVSNDWKPIPLWYRDQSEVQRQEAQRFCYELWQQIAVKEQAILKEPTLVFGQSETSDQATSIPLPGFKSQSKYGKQGRWQIAFVELQRKDPTFRDFLKRKDIDPLHLDTASQKKKDSIIRKIAPLVSYRERFIRSVATTGHVALNTPQVHPEIYSGWEAICAVCEGNPRWFKGIVDVLTKEWLSSNRSLSRSFQARELQRASTRFRALVAACPIGDSVSMNFPQIGPAQLIEKIATFQKNHLLHRPFSSDPPLSIDLGTNESAELKQLVSVCLNIGALISMDEDDSAISLSELGGRRFRLSYLLAPSFVLPLRSGAARSLASVLALKKKPIISTQSESGEAFAYDQVSLWSEVK